MAARLWPVLFHPLCEQELHHVSAAVQDELLAMAKLLEQTGPDKRGQNERRFYRRLITAADRRFNEHLAGLSEAGDTQ